jgi:transposase
LYSKQLKRCERHLSSLLPESDQQIKILMTALGISIVISRIILTELFSIKDFNHPKYVISFAGLAPIVDESSNKFGMIKLNRYCNYYLKYAFIMAAHSARTYIRYRKKYNNDIKENGKIRAKINLARRIVKSVYRMLIRQHNPFHDMGALLVAVRQAGSTCFYMIKIKILFCECTPLGSKLRSLQV